MVGFKAISAAGNLISKDSGPGFHVTGDLRLVVGGSDSCGADSRKEAAYPIN